jgi:FixJ family two-component response regulator
LEYATGEFLSITIRPLAGVLEVKNKIGSDSPVVYVVDDDPMICTALVRLLETAELEAEAFPSARAFLACPVSDRPACLILDLRLPGPSGLELQKALRESGRDLPIIFVTGHGDVPSTVSAMKGGAIDFLQKPFDSEALLDCVRRALAHSVRHRAERAVRHEVHVRLDQLTRREREVMLHVITGKLNKQIAADLGISEKTIKVHRGRVMQKMRVDSVVELARLIEKTSPAGS